MVNFLSHQGWTEILHDVQCAHVQVDIIARSPAPESLLTLIEVKMQSAWGMAHLTHRQRARLMKAAAHLGACEPVQLVLALVEGEKVRLLPVDALTDY